mgnify:FL=1
MVLRDIFENKCEKNKTGFDNIGYKIFFICWIALYWLNVTRFIFLPTRKDTMVYVLLIATIYTYYLYNMFMICRPWTGIFIPMLIGTILYILIHFMILNVK